MVVTGVLVALALNAWYQGRQNAASETGYLELLSRDLETLSNDLDAAVAFETLQFQDGLTVYRALSSPHRPKDTSALSSAMARLGVRHTVILKKATYEDLISTGNLRLIRNGELRDQIVQFYETTQVQIDIIDKNNSFFVDDMYSANVILRGLILARPVSNPTRRLAPVDSMIMAELQPGYVEEQDRLWTLPDSAPEWAMVKSNLSMRLRIAAVAKSLASNRAQAARELKQAIDAELER